MQKLMDFSEIADEFQKTLTLEQHVENEEHDNDDDEDDFEFSFAGSDIHSPVSAEDVFQNGQIRTIFQFADDTQAGSSDDATTTTSYSPSVRKLFVVSSSENGDVAEGAYCEWSENSPAPEMRRKSNSTGLSKLWRVKDLLIRSHSDGKESLVFVKAAEETTSSGGVKKAKIKVVKTESSGEGKKEKKKSAYEVLYGNREKKAGGKSYLPYRQDLVGFFTNSNAITRNVHPY